MSGTRPKQRLAYAYLSFSCQGRIGLSKQAGARNSALVLFVSSLSFFYSLFLFSDVGTVSPLVGSEDQVTNSIDSKKPARPKIQEGAMTRFRSASCFFVERKKEKDRVVLG